MSEFFGIPISEIHAEMERQFDLHKMDATEKRHKVYEFIDSLGKEQLSSLGTLVRAFAEDGSSYAKFIDGYVSAIAKEKFDLCPACGENHDEMLNEMTQQKVNDQFESDLDKAVSEPEPPQFTAYVLTEEDLDNMEKYNLDDLRDEEPPHHLLGFKCLGCEMRYVSIADRMLRPPGIDGCNGCQLKSAHG